MAITKGNQQAIAVETEDNLLVMIAPASTLAAGKSLTDLKVSDLTSAAFVDVTYDLTAGSGWAETTSQETITDDRLTSSQTFALPGKITNGLTVQMVYGDETAVADPLLVEGEKFICAVRWAVEHDQDIAQTDKFDFWLVKAGAKQRDQAAANSVFTKTQLLYPLQKVQRDVTPAAA